MKEVGWQLTLHKDGDTFAAGDALGDGQGICLQGPHRCVAKAADRRPGKGVAVNPGDTGKGCGATPYGLRGRGGDLSKNSLRGSVNRKGLG